MDISGMYIVKSADQEFFYNELKKIVNREQDEKHRKVEIQYKPLISDKHDSVIYTAMVISKE